MVDFSWNDDTIGRRMVVATAGRTNMNTGVLHRLRARLAGWYIARFGLWMLAAVCAMILGAILLDAALDLPDALRAASPWLLAFGLLASTGLAIIRWRAWNEFQVARLFERCNTTLGNRISNAVQLSSQTTSTAMQEYLRQEAVQLGQHAAANL